MLTPTQNPGFRFRLKTLLVAVGIFSIVLGLASSVTHWQLRNSRERAAMVAVGRFGGTSSMESALRWDATGERPSWFYCQILNRVAKIDLSQDAWPLVERRKQGQSSPQVSDDDLPILQAFADLKILDLSGTAITDGGLKHLMTLRSLDELELDGTQISDVGVRRLNDALPSCRIRR